VLRWRGSRQRFFFPLVLWSGIIPVEIRVQIEIEEYLMTECYRCNQAPTTHISDLPEEMLMHKYECNIIWHVEQLPEADADRLLFMLHTTCLDAPKMLIP
jgi:hypothetical protein